MRKYRYAVSPRPACWSWRRPRARPWPAPTRPRPSPCSPSVRSAAPPSRRAPRSRPASPRATRSIWRSARRTRRSAASPRSPARSSRTLRRWARPTLSITSQTLTGCSLPGVSGVTLKSITAINTPWSAGITTKNKLTITGAKKSKPVGVKAVISLGSSTLTCVFTAAKTSGKTANKHNTVTFKNQSLALDSGRLVGPVLIRWHEGNLLRGLRAGAGHQREASPARVRPVADSSSADRAAARRPAGRTGWASASGQTTLRRPSVTNRGRPGCSQRTATESGAAFHVTARPTSRSPSRGQGR